MVGVELQADASLELPADASVELPTDSGVETDAGVELPTDAGVDAFGAACAPPEDASPCTEDLSNIGTGDFHVSLTLTTSQQGLVAVVNQRSACGGGMYWDVRIESGHMVVETDDGVFEPDGAVKEDPRTTLTSNVTANDGDPHCIRIDRVAEVLSIRVDGVLTGSASSVSSFQVLAPLAMGTDPCEGTVDMTMALTGTISGLCVGGP